MYIQKTRCQVRKRGRAPRGRRDIGSGYNSLVGPRKTYGMGIASTAHMPAWTALEADDCGTFT